MKPYLKLLSAKVSRLLPPALIPFLTLCLCLCAGSPGRAAERVWDGGARGNGWEDTGNWVGLGVPATGDDLRFPAGALQPGNNNDFASGTVFNRLTFAGAGYSVSGNEVALTGGILLSHGAGNTVLNLPISIEANQTFTVSLAGANLFLNGSVELGRTRSVLTFDGAGQTVVVGNVTGSGLISGGGAIRKNGPGALYILQAVTFGGGTTVNGGTLRVDGSLSNSAVTLNAGATLLGTGKVGGLTANSGSTVNPGSSSPDIFDSLGDLALNAGSTLNIRLGGTTAGLNYDQLRVQGAVTLGGALNVTATFVPSVGERFTIIDNDGNDDVQGTFAGLPEGAILTINGRPFKISYGERWGVFGRDVNDVVLEAVPALSVWDGGGGYNKFWSQPLNWVGDVLPLPGDDIQFADTGIGMLTAINDFAAGRRFGSLIFAGGQVKLEGNPIEVEGGIRAVQPGELELALPMTLKAGVRITADSQITMTGPLTLASSQTFRVEHADGHVSLNNNTTLGSYGLIFDLPHAETTIGNVAYAAALNGTVSGQGTITKNGDGSLIVRGTNYCATTVNGGTLNTQPKAGLFGFTLINAGAVLDDVWATFTDVEVRGGTLWPSFGTRIDGTLRILDGGNLGISIAFNPGPQAVISTYVYAGNPVELIDANLLINVGASTAIDPSAQFSVISGASATGTFNGLPEGTRMLVNGHVFAITYQVGVKLIGSPPFYWDGGGSGNVWSTAANWSPDFGPIAGSALVFPANVTKVGMINDLAPGTSLRSLTFGAASYLLVGNAFRLTEGIYNDFASGETTITADFVVSGNSFECRVGDASRLKLEGGVTRAGVGGFGSASWKKTGTGTLRFTGAAPNSQSAVDVQAGELELDKPSGVDAISALLAIGDGTNDVRVTLLGNHQIADDADVTIRNRARLALNGNHEAIDRLQGEGTVSLHGRLGPIRSSWLTVNSGNFSGAFVGEGGLTKAGSSASVLSLSGVSSFSGLTILSGGTLSVDGVQTNSPIRLDGGLLRGRGQVGPIIGNLGGIVQPGLTAPAYQNRLHSRDVAFNSSTTFRPVLTSGDPGFENSQLRVTGGVNLGGSVLDVELIFIPSPGDSFVILENDGTDAVVGSFAALPEGALINAPTPNLRWRITYAGGDGNDVMLTLVAIDFQPTFTSISMDPNPPSGSQLVRISATAVPRAGYELQTTTDLLNWTPRGAYIANADGIITIHQSQPLSASRLFHRLKLRE